LDDEKRRTKPKEDKLMPGYDYKCKECDKEVTVIWSHPEYQEVLDGKKESKCPDCDSGLKQTDRVFGKGVSSRTIGVSKGNYNSNH
jgi:predicted nucleic acid-binding Zn ribbon protein